LGHGIRIIENVHGDRQKSSARERNQMMSITKVTVEALDFELDAVGPCTDEQTETKYVFSVEDNEWVPVPTPVWWLAHLRSK
jgi:hypothetical protein